MGCVIWFDLSRTLCRGSPSLRRRLPSLSTPPPVYDEFPSGSQPCPKTVHCFCLRVSGSGRTAPNKVAASSLLLVASRRSSINRTTSHHRQREPVNTNLH